jgi:hypothetical protein
MDNRYIFLKMWQNELDKGDESNNTNYIFFSKISPQQTPQVSPYDFESPCIYY